MPISVDRPTWRQWARSPLRQRAAQLIAHEALAALAWTAAFALHDDLRLLPADRERCLAALPWLLLVRAILLVRSGLDRAYWQHASVRDLRRLLLVATIGSVALPLVLAEVGALGGIGAAVFILDWLLVLALMSGAMVGARAWSERRYARPAAGKRTLIVGAGEAGEQLLRQVLHSKKEQYDVVGLIDDDEARHGRQLHGVPVLGDTGQLQGFVALYRVRVLLIAVPSASPEQRRRLVDRCTATGAEVRILPPLKDQVTADVEIREMREVRIEDLLGREPVHLDLSAAAKDIAGRVVLITGAGGSIGSELARQVARFNPVRLVLLERAESPLYFIHLETARDNPAVDVVPVLASVTNAERLREVFARYRPDIVFHAAAYKHVPMLEWNAVEGVWNNVVGTLRLAQAAARAGTAKFVLISTDKAVNPTSILGATKLIAEKVVLDLPSLLLAPTDFRVVRFGNVLGSDGSVVPLFQKQLAAGGPLTVTHPEVRRYFMTIPEAVQLVLQAASLPEAAGGIALLEMGTQVRVLDLAENLTRLAGLVPGKDVEIVFTGLRPGEKLREELVAHGEKARTTRFEKLRVVERNGTAAKGSTLAERLRHLMQVTARLDEPGLRRAIAALVPEYRPDGMDAAYAGGGNGNGRHNGRHGAPRNGGNGSHGEHAVRVIAAAGESGGGDR